MNLRASLAETRGSEAIAEAELARRGPRNDRARRLAAARERLYGPEILTLGGLISTLEESRPIASGSSVLDEHAETQGVTVPNEVRAYLKA